MDDKFVLLAQHCYLRQGDEAVVIATRQHFPHQSDCLNGLMNNIGHGSPNAEGIFRTYLDLGIIRIGWH